MKALGLTWEVHWKRYLLSTGEEGGIPGVEVKFVEIGRNTSGVGAFLRLLTLRRESVGSKQD